MSAINSLIPEHLTMDDLWASEHLVKGVLFRFYHQKRYETQWKQQWFRNQVASDFLNDMASKLSELGIRPVLLKGMALLDNIYEDSGLRFMSDIDILIDQKHFENLVKLYEREGFSNITGQTWKGNNFKVELTKLINNVEINLEIHSKLFYHKEDITWNFQNHSIPPYLKLAPEEMLVHLIGHYAFQHNFSKLYWFIDIVAFIEKNHDHLDWQRVLLLAKQMDLYRGVISTLAMVRQMTSFDIPTPSISFLLSLFITPKFILDPLSSLTRYYLIKHLVKDSLRLALWYDLKWFMHKFLSKK